MRHEIRTTINADDGSKGGKQAPNSPMKQVQSAPPLTKQQNSADLNKMHIERRDNGGAKK